MRDATMGEDASPVRTGAAPQVLAAVRTTALGLLRLAKVPKVAEALRRHARHPHEALALLGIHLDPT